MNWMMQLLGVAAAVAATAAGVALSNVGMRVAPQDESLLRLSWRAQAERVERCRVPSAEDLAGLPQHMRPAEICEGRLASFRLVVELDGATVIDRELRPAGAREDRPTYVLEVMPIAPGPHRLVVGFSAIGEFAVPPLRVESTIEPGPRDVVLVTREPGGELVIR